MIKGFFIKFNAGAQRILGRLPKKVLKLKAISKILSSFTLRLCGFAGSFLVPREAGKETAKNFDRPGYFWDGC
jgi:hypothetical protein